MKHIVLTGGGTAGHVTPNIALIENLHKNNYKISYIGSKNGIEKELITSENIDYYEIPSGKLRRYIDIENVKDTFKVIKGVFSSIKLLKKLKPNIVFSKGGFVSVPVVIGAYFNKIPIIIHESDLTPGLANKICIKFANKICVSFPETLKYLPKDKGVLTGPPIRSKILQGEKSKGYKLTNFNDKLPILLVIGGSLGSVTINSTIQNILPKLTEKFQVVHICGKNNINTNLINTNNYIQFEYLNEELKDILSISDIVLSRAGSNSIFEFLTLNKPNLLIPLSKKASRGDQILNANSFKNQGFSHVLEEENITNELLLKEINNLYENKENIIKNMKSYSKNNGTNTILEIIYKNS